MIAKFFVGLFVVTSAFLGGPGHRAGAQEPPAKEPAKKEIPALAKEIVKMKVVRVMNEKREFDRAEKTIEDKEKIGQLLVLFPEVGTDKKPDAALPGGGGPGLRRCVSDHTGAREGRPSLHHPAATGNSGSGRKVLPSPTATGI